MSINFFPRWMTLPFLLMLTILACGTPSSLTSEPPEATATQDAQTESIPTETLQPTTTQSTPTDISAQATITPSSSCTLLRELNLRYGPGTAYNPRIRLLPVNSIVTPLGFAPNGIPPGRSWAYVQDITTLDKGWISAGNQDISCNVEVASLELVAFGTPVPPPLPDTSQASPGPGTCGQGGVFSDNGIDVYDCSVAFSADSFIQFIITKNGVEAGKADGVQNVNFSVTKNNDPIYDHTENNAPYCIFGGDNACSSWPLEDYFYKWKSGGAVLEPGVYTISITPTLDDFSVNLFWSADVTVRLP